MLHAGSSMIQNDRSARHFMIEGGISLVGKVHKGFGTLVGHFGPFSAPNANGAIPSDRLTTDRSGRGVWATKGPGWIALRGGTPPP